MKKYLILLAAISLSFTAIINNPIERMGIKGPIVYNKTNFNLAWSDKPNENYFVQEYLPKGENVEHFNQLLTIHLFVSKIEVKDAVQQKMNELTKRKETDEVCNFSTNKSPDGKEFILDCILSSKKGTDLDTVEFIIYRYKQIELPNNKKGILIFAYSKRSYGDEILNFLANLRNDRMLMLNTMISTTVPEVNLNGQ